MTEKNLVSIIIPTFNRADLLVETLDSIIEQTYKNWECIIVDDGSSQDTLSIIKKFTDSDERFRFFNRPDHLPKSGNSCRNYGLKMSEGEFVNFFDSDDIMLPDFLSSRMEKFDHALLQISIASYIVTDEKLNFKTQSNFVIKNNLLKSYLFWECPLLTPSLLIRKTFLDNKILFDATIKRGQETDFFLNILKNLDQNEYTMVKKPTFLYRHHADTITAKTIFYNPDYNESLIRIRSKAYFIGEEQNDLEMKVNSHFHLVLLLLKAIKNSDDNAIKTFNSYYLKRSKDLKKFHKLEIQSVSFLLSLLKKTPKFYEKRWIGFIS